MSGIETALIVGAIASAAAGAGEIYGGHLEGKQAKTASRQQEANAMLEGRRERGAMLAQQAAGVGRAGTGTGMDLLAESASIARHNALIARYHGKVGRRNARLRMAMGGVQAGAGLATAGVGAYGAMGLGAAKAPTYAMGGVMA